MQLNLAPTQTRMISTADILKSKILVVDDKATNVDLMRGMLALAGYTAVDSTTDPAKVCDLHAENRYDLIILDLLMPGMDGFEVMTALNKIERHGYLSVLVVTAQPLHKLRALEAGARDFLSKPFDVSELGARVRNLIEVRLLNQQALNYAQAMKEMVRELESNREMVRLKAALEEKVEQLALRSKYKSEFLANMSHEIRTPLNNLLLLADVLAANPEGNLTAKQVEYAKTIRLSGTDLLTLINNVLDLSKVESGRVDLDIAETEFSAVGSYCLQAFKNVAESKGIQFTIAIDTQLAGSIVTDVRYLQQILKNLLSNALKFTAQGSVTLQMEPSQTGVAFTVTDTGIGVAENKQEFIFEAFQQADGSTTRNYGGTGLGLSISRQLAHLLGGEIQVSSRPGEGSSFVLSLPLIYGASAEAEPLAEAKAAQRNAVPSSKAAEVEDDRARIAPGDPLLLIVEDDPTFAGILMEMAHARGLKAFVASSGNAALALASAFLPQAITLDVGLPDMQGWPLLDRLKQNPETRHIPVYVISGTEESRLAMSLGASGFVLKGDGVGLADVLEQIGSGTRSDPSPPPAIQQSPPRDAVLHGTTILLVDDDLRSVFALKSALEPFGIQVLHAASGPAGIDMLLRYADIEAVLVDIMMPGMDGLELMQLVRRMPQFQDLPMVAVTAKAMQDDREECLAAGASDYVTKPIDLAQLTAVLRVLISGRLHAGLVSAK